MITLPHAVLAVGLMVAFPSLAAVPDAGVDAGPQDVIPRSPAHHALEKQVELLRAEVAKPRAWHERDKTDRIRVELKAAESVLEELDGILGERLASCRALWLDQQTVHDPAAGGHPGWFGCNAKIHVTDEMVANVRRRQLVEERLKDPKLAFPAQQELEAERKRLLARMDEMTGTLSLYVEHTQPVILDAGPAEVVPMQPLQPLRPMLPVQPVTPRR